MVETDPRPDVRPNKVVPGSEGLPRPRARCRSRRDTDDLPVDIVTPGSVLLRGRTGRSFWVHFWAKGNGPK